MDVVGKHILTGKTSRAQLTLVLSPVDVDTNMPMQGIPMQKGCIAYMARERLFTCVRHDVPVHRTLVRKRRLADGAANWSFTRVNAKVPVQITLQRKRLFADGADEQFCTRVNTKVSVQMMPL